MRPLSKCIFEDLRQFPIILDNRDVPPFAITNRRKYKLIRGWRVFINIDQSRQICLGFIGIFRKGIIYSCKYHQGEHEREFESVVDFLHKKYPDNRKIRT